MENDNTIILTDEHGNEVKFEFLDLIEYDSEEYVVLLPLDDTDEPAEVIILKIEDTGEETVDYVSVDDEQTLQAVFEIFKARMKGDFNFIDES